MASIVTYNAIMHAKNSAANDIRKTDAYIMAFAYATTASKKQGYQD